MARSNIPPPPLEIYFSPEAKIQAKIIKRINATESSIDLALYSFTSSELAQALVRAHRRGVKVRAVRDSVQTGAIDDKGSYLKQHGIPMRKLAGTGQGGEMHNQFAVFDRKEVLTGSYSWTHKGDKSNVEDALLTQESAIVQAYKKEFKRLWKAPRKPAARKKAPKRTSELASN